MESSVDNAMPQWKKDLIARLRNQNKTVAAVSSEDQQLYASPQHASDRAVHQPSLTCKSESVTSGSSCLCGGRRCNVNSATCKNSEMVQERVWVDPLSEMVSENYSNGYHKDSDSDSSEDLHYGPGIVKRLQNKYLSLALRQSSTRPSVLHLRKATSLENLLDDNTQSSRLFKSRLNGNDTHKNSQNRYRNAARGEMKRARSVETISRFDNIPLVSSEEVKKPNRQSLHEEMLIAAEKEGNDHPFRKMPDNAAENKFTSSIVSDHRINRPKRIQPLMNEKEKPPADVVKQAKMIFERRPEQRTRAPPQTGDVAAKVDSFNNIIVKAKVEAKVSSKKTIIKNAKPVLNDKIRSNTRPVARPVIEKPKAQVTSNLELEAPKTENFSLPSPIPDISRVDFHNRGENEQGRAFNSLSETPDLILTSNPLPAATSPTYKKNSTENFLREEIRNSSPLLERKNGQPASPKKSSSPLLSPKKLSSPLLSPTRVKPASPLLSPSINRPTSPIKYKPATPIFVDESDNTGNKSANVSKGSGAPTIFNFGNQKVHEELVTVNKNVSDTKTPPSQPLKIEVNGAGDIKLSPKPRQHVPRGPPKFSPPPPPPSRAIERKPENVLTVTEIEKNYINIAKTLQQPDKSSVSANSGSVEVLNKNVVQRKIKPRETSNTAIFNFTSRKDVPDYIANDRSRTPGRPELPKPGEGGIILIPGATILESFTDEDEEIMRSLECPPSPCDVTFVNDNVLIDGKSSLNQKTKRTKLKISFVEAGPDIYEYPSETSMLLDDSPISPAQVGHTVPNLGGSSLANYTPKSTEEFQPGITRSVQQTVQSKPDVTEVDSESSEVFLEPVDKPFSSGSNTDILF